MDWLSITGLVLFILAAIAVFAIKYQEKHHKIQ